MKSNAQTNSSTNGNNTQQGSGAGTNTSQPAPLNYNLLLKKGMNGPEVAELQRRLGNLDDDGAFGNLTEARLQAVKCVKEIRLVHYDTTNCDTNSNNTNSQPWYGSLPYGWAIFG